MSFTHYWRGKASEHWIFIIYRLLLIATSKLKDANKEFDDSAVFWCILLIVGGGKLQNIDGSSLVILEYQLLPETTG